MAQETGPITGTKDEDYNIIGFTEACLNNVLRLETSGRPPLCRAIPSGKRQALATMRKPAFLHGCQRRIRSKMPWPCGLGVVWNQPEIGETMDEETRDKLIDLYTRYGDEPAAVQAAPRTG